MNDIRFKFAARKGLAALHYMVAEKANLDLHQALKACYFADKKHLNDHDRPVFGATYQAMRFGPVPLEIYEMAKGEALWLAELSLDKLPWELQGFHFRRRSNSAPHLGAFSKSDLSALEYGVKQSASMTFDERTKATHGPDWQKARMGLMRYEDMIEEREGNNVLIAYLREAAPTMRL